MFDYLQQFNSLPKDLRDKVSSKEVMSFLNDLETRYQVDLAMVVMKVMIKTLAIRDLASTFVSEFNLAPDKAEALTQEMKTKVFSAVSDYVGITVLPEKIDVSDNIDALIKEAGITIPNSDLAERLKRIVATYLKGIRQRIDARQALAKDVASGGLGLGQVEIDRVFKVCDSKKFEAKKTITPPASPIDRIINQNENTKTVVSPDKTKLFNQVVEYDLKRALASGETKSIAPPHPAIIKGDEKEKQKIDLDDIKAGSKEKTLSEFGSSQEKKISEPVKENDAKADIEQELKKMEGDKKDGVDANKEINQSLKEASKVTPATNNAPVPAKAKEPFIVKKPESHSLFKGLFTESQKKASPGAVKIAQVAQTQIKPDSLLASAQSRKTPNPVIDKKKLQDKLDNLKNTPQRQAQAPVNPNKPRLVDVKPAPKVMGPLEELLYLDITNFRRLGKTPEEVTAKIFGKIKLLEVEGYDKMIAGISAWKRSPVNRMYLKMVQYAIANGKTVKEVATAGALKGSLNFEEIEAIINLNSRLTF